jgi:hypothetical protein
MSTDFITARKIAMSDLYDGRMEKYQVTEYRSEKTTESARCLTDGDHFLWVYRSEDGTAAIFTRYGWNFPIHIHNAISAEFNTSMYADYDPQFWGYDSDASWKEANKKAAAQERDRFYDTILKFVAGEDVEEKPGTNGWTRLEIARTRVRADPELLLQDNRGRLLDLVDEIYEQHHVHRVTLTETDLAPLHAAIRDAREASAAKFAAMNSGK